jgi:hypothetical protein
MNTTKNITHTIMKFKPRLLVNLSFAKGKTQILGLAEF